MWGDLVMSLTVVGMVEVREVMLVAGKGERRGEGVSISC